MTQVPDEFFTLGASEGDLLGIRHNEMNLDRYQTFQAALPSLFKEVEHETRQEELKKNLLLWDERQVGVFQEAKLRNVRDRKAAEAAVKVLKSGERPHGFFLRGPARSGKTFFGLALVRALIGLGYATPSQVYQTSEDRLLAFLKGGFEGFTAVNEPFKRSYRIYLIENVGAKSVYDDREAAYWEQLLDHMARYNLIPIFTSEGSATGFQGKLSPLAAARLGHFVEGRVIAVNSAKNEGSAPLDALTAEELRELEEQREKEKALERPTSTKSRTRRGPRA